MSILKKIAAVVLKDQIRDALTANDLLKASKDELIAESHRLQVRIASLEMLVDAKDDTIDRLHNESLGKDLAFEASQEDLKTAIFALEILAVNGSGRFTSRVYGEQGMICKRNARQLEYHARDCLNLIKSFLDEPAKP